MPNFMKELHITGLNELTRKTKFTAKQQKAINNIKNCSDDKWEYVNSWYDEKDKDCRALILSPKKLFNIIYDDSLSYEYGDGYVAFNKEAQNRVKDIRFCGKEFLEKVTFYHVVELIQEAFSEVEGTQEDAERIIKELYEIRNEIEDIKDGKIT